MTPPPVVPQLDRIYSWREKAEIVQCILEDMRNEPGPTFGGHYLQRDLTSAQMSIANILTGLDTAERVDQ